MIVAVVITIKAIANWPEKDFGTSTGFEPVASTLALQCSTKLSYEDPDIESRPSSSKLLKGMKHEDDVNCGNTNLKEGI